MSSSANTSDRVSTLSPSTEGGPIQPGWYFRWGTFTAYGPFSLSRWECGQWAEWCSPILSNLYCQVLTASMWQWPPIPEELNQKPLPNPWLLFGLNPSPEACLTQWIRLMTGSSVVKGALSSLLGPCGAWPLWCSHPRVFPMADHNLQATPNPSGSNWMVGGLLQTLTHYVTETSSPKLTPLAWGTSMLPDKRKS